MVTIRKWPTITTSDTGSDHVDLFVSEDPRLIAASLKRIAETSRCQGTPYDRAMKILSDHRAQDSSALSTRQHQIIDEVKDWLRDLFMMKG